jgi:GTPase SAR1 family protein
MDAYLLVYDISNIETFANLNSQIEYIKSHRNPTKASCVILIGNKFDDPNSREVEKEKAERYATDMRLPYVECSALNGNNIDEVFNLLVRELRKLGFRKVDMLS